MRKVVLVVHNVRSAHNVGSILRSADGFGVSEVYLTGYTPYPAGDTDKRLPHVIQRAQHQISKTALGAEKIVRWHHAENIYKLIEKLRKAGYTVAALEQTPAAIPLHAFTVQRKIAVIVGNEVGGLEQKLLQATDTHIVIPMLGAKESLNVAIATAVALYHLRYA